MSGRAVALTVLRPLAIAFAVVAGLLAVPVAGMLAVAGWQEYAPGSLRYVVHEISVLTEASDVDGVVDNFIAAIDGGGRKPG